MNPYQKETLNLQVGDWIIWKDQPQDLIHEDGARTTYLTPGMRERVVEREMGEDLASRQETDLDSASKGSHNQHP